MRAVILAGATASGKSARACAMAQREGGIIINADVLQMYRDLPILTARPTAEEEAEAPHLLYGVLEAEEQGSVALWLAQVIPEIRNAWAERKLPIITGGTGMYLYALHYGISEIPDIPPDVRTEVRGWRQYPACSLHARLAECDPVMAARLKPGDTQRLLRALEVFRATGRSLADWQEEKARPPLPEAKFEVQIVELPRAELYARINARFLTMLEAGAVEEVESLLYRFGEEKLRGLPVLRACGAEELLDYVLGRTSLDEATTRAQTRTRQYAKRQLTWLRHRM